MPRCVVHHLKEGGKESAHKSRPDRVPGILGRDFEALIIRLNNAWQSAKKRERVSATADGIINTGSSELVAVDSIQPHPDNPRPV